MRTCAIEQRQQRRIRDRIDPGEQLTRQLGRVRLQRLRGAPERRPDARGVRSITTRIVIAVERRKAAGRQPALDPIEARDQRDEFLTPFRLHEVIGQLVQEVPIVGSRCPAVGTLFRV